jgi:beta-1,4-mannosyltransferase
MGTKIKIAVFPFNTSLNPYISLLYKNIKQESPKFEFTRFYRHSFLFTVRRIHLHWPEYLFKTKGVIQNTLFMIMFLIFKLLGGKVIITAHNLKPHDKQNRLNKLYLKTVYLLSNGIIRLGKNKSVAKGISESHTQIFIPHGHYRDIYPNNISKDEARQQLNLGDQDEVGLFFGQIRRYKNIKKLVKIFNQEKLLSYKLIIAGMADSQYLEEVKPLVENQNITIINKFIPDEEVQIYFVAADYVIIPYSKKVLNSGVCLLALSFNKPIILPETEEFLALREEFSPQVIHLYQSRDQIPEIINTILNNKAHINCSFKGRSWEMIAKKHIGFYEKIY